MKSLPAMEVAYVERSLPGADLDAARDLARRWDLRVERRDADWNGVPDPQLVVLQAYSLHEQHPLDPDPLVRGLARAAVKQTIERAGRAGVPYVLTAPGFGDALVRDPVDVAFAAYREFVETAERAGVTLLVELLSPRRLPVLSRAADLAQWMRALDAGPRLQVALDTGHLLDAGLDPLAVVRDWPLEVGLLQLRGPGGAFPPHGMPLKSLLSEARPAVVSVEHHERVEEPQVEAFVARLRRARERALAADETAGR
jgi:hypothetical protein